MNLCILDTPPQRELALIAIGTFDLNEAGVHGVPGGENMLALPDLEVRYFTVREAARLQTFPDDYYFPCNWGESMRQIGNAVPVNLAYILAKSIRNHLQELTLSRKILGEV